MPSAQYMYVPAPPSLTVHAHGTHAMRRPLSSDPSPYGILPPPRTRRQPAWVWQPARVWQPAGAP
jgi:hypothetical protein